ncbi:MAG: hypothetical protein ACRBN8_03590 [Nannocystales bacterium]
MSSPKRIPNTVVEKVARLTSDLTLPSDPAKLSRVQALASSLLARPAASEDEPVLVRGLAGVAQPLRVALDEEALETLGQTLRADIAEREDQREGAETDVVEMRRVEDDGATSLLAVDRLSGLRVSERVGPFNLGAREVWFEAFFAAKAMTVVRTGEPRPLLALSRAHRPRTSRGTTTLDLQAGTVWVRGDLISSALPANAYVGIQIRDGSLALSGAASVDGDTVELGGALTGTLTLELQTPTVQPQDGGCRAAGATIELPEKLVFAFKDGALRIKGSSGRATAWDQTFHFKEPRSTWSYITDRWTAVLHYAVEPDTFSFEPFSDALATFTGKARIERGGLGFPVVSVADPAVLDEASVAPQFLLDLREFSCRWYSPDERFHAIAQAWLGISASGTMLFANDVAALSPAVVFDHVLWEARGAGGRLPWTHRHPAPFVLLHACDLVAGEAFAVSGEGLAGLDRPLQTDAEPIPAARGRGLFALLRRDKRVEATLMVVEESPQAAMQLALRNGLVWVSKPVYIVAQGQRGRGQTIEKGRAALLMGAYGWCPTLPDPYVSNVCASSPGADRPSPTGRLVAEIAWSNPETVSVSFEGQLGRTLAKPVRGMGPQQDDHDRRPVALGLTQVDQHRLQLSEREQARWDKAQSKEQDSRAKRLDAASRSNKESMDLLGAVWSKFHPARPNVALLDVSTNQDLLGVALEAHNRDEPRVAASHLVPGVSASFAVDGLDVQAALARMVVMTLPAIQWEPVRTLDVDQDVATLGWFPTPLASATDGGPSVVGVRSQRLTPIVPDEALERTQAEFEAGQRVGLRTTLPFGLMATAIVNPDASSARKADLLQNTRPKFPTRDSVGGHQITAVAEHGRLPGGVSPTFEGAMRQVINGVDLATGAPLGLSVLGSTADPSSNVETVFNNDMASNPRVPVTRFDISGYGASNFSEWENPFAAFAETAKVQFSVIKGRTAMEIIKVNSVLHPWGIRVTRSVTIERRPGGGVVRRDSGWQPITPGMFDYRYADTTGNILNAPYRFDAGVFRGMFDVRSIRPAPGTEVSSGGATFIPYYFDANVALDGASGRTQAIGMLGYLQTTPDGEPASGAALRDLVESQGAVGGPLDVWIDVGNSGLPFRVRRLEVAIAMDMGGPVLVATVRGVPRLPTTGAWSVVKRPVAGVADEHREAVPVSEGRGVPLIRRYPVTYPTASQAVFAEPPLTGLAGPYRFADPADLYELSPPEQEYALLQSTPTHAFLFPRPLISSTGSNQLQTGGTPALADVIARTTSKGAFPPPPNTIDLPGTLFFDVAPSGTLSLSSPINIAGHPTPLRLSGENGHGTKMNYDHATLRMVIDHGHWEAEFTGLEIYNDIAGMERISGSRLRVVGSTQQRPQIAEIESLVHDDIESILQFIPLFGQRGTDGPIELGTTNAKHEFKFEASLKVDVPRVSITLFAGADLKLKLKLAASTGFDKDTGLVKNSGKFGLALEGKIPVLSIGIASVFVIVSVGADFAIDSIAGGATSEKLALNAFAGVGVEGAIGPFKAYAYLGVGFILSYDITNDKAKYGGLVALEAGIDFTIVKVKVRAELKGLCYDDAGATKCDYSGSVKVQVDIFLIFSISASYTVSDTTTL